MGGVVSIAAASVLIIGFALACSGCHGGTRVTSSGDVWVESKDHEVGIATITSTSIRQIIIRPTRETHDW